MPTCLLILTLANSGVRVGQFDVKLFGSGNDIFPCLERYRVSNFSNVCCVVHQQNFQLFYVVDQKRVEVIGAKKFRLVVRTEANFCHWF